MSDEMTLEERKVIYRARRGLKEIDVYFDPYVKKLLSNCGSGREGLICRISRTRRSRFARLVHGSF